MVNNPTYYSQRSFRSPKQRLVRWSLLALLVMLLAGLIALSTNAYSPSAAEMHLQILVHELQQDRLTAGRQNAQRELESAGEEAVPALMTALHSDNPILRRNAADMLGYIASARSTGSLQYTLGNDPAAAVRVNAARALGEIDSYVQFHDLTRASLMDSSARVRTAARDSLARIHTRLALSAEIDERELSAFAVAPSSSDVIYIAVRRNLLVSHDGGKTWNTLQNVLPGLTTVLTTSPTDPQTLYAGVDSMGIYKSMHGGREWVAINNGLNIPAGGRFEISAITIDPAKPAHLLIATGAILGTGNVEFVPVGVLQSTDGGETWNQMPNIKPHEPLTQLLFEENRVFALAGSKVTTYPID